MAALLTKLKEEIRELKEKNQLLVNATVMITREFKIDIALLKEEIKILKNRRD